MISFKENMKKGISKIRITITALLLLSILLLTGCSGIFYIPGASYGYYIWEENNDIFVEWSVDRKDTKFDGSISTDGTIVSYKLKEWEEENDIIRTSKESIDFSATLGSRDYSDGFSFTVQDYTYLEFDLKINDGYDLSRVNLGSFLENPENTIFRIGKGYFNQLKMRPWYQKHPFSEFFHKLFSNKYFTFLYISILGIIIIEILRVTIFSGRKRRPILLMVSYAGLAVIEVSIYFILRFFNG